MSEDADKELDEMILEGYIRATCPNCSCILESVQLVKCPTCGTGLNSKNIYVSLIDWEKAN